MGATVTPPEDEKTEGQRGGAPCPGPRGGPGLRGQALRSDRDGGARAGRGGAQPGTERGARWVCGRLTLTMSGF